MEKIEPKVPEQEKMEREAEERERQIVRFTNIDKESFTHSFRGISITVIAGASQVMRLPEADHLAIHLARKILSREKKAKMSEADKQKGGQLWTESEIYDLKTRILSEIATEEPKNISVQEAHKRDSEELNKKYTSQEVNITKKDVVKELESRGQKVDVSKSKEDLLNELMELEAKGI